MKTHCRATLLRLTSQYLGYPFKDNWCGDGEGSSIDERPMDNWSALDCVTYIEAVLANYFGGEYSRVLALKSLRYNRMPATFLHRNHFIRFDWLPNALSRGFLSDLTTTVFSANQLKVKVWNHDPSSWFRQIGADHVYCAANAERRLESLHNDAASLPVQQVASVVVPLMLLLPTQDDSTKGEPESGWTRLAKLPSGTLLVFFGSQGEHMAWLINESTGLKIRHASRVRRNVRDDNLATFVRLQVSQSYLDGLAVFEVAPADAFRAEAGAMENA